MFETRKYVMLAALLLVAISAHAQQTLRVAAAADLEPVLPKILTEFEAATRIHAEASFKSSAVLATQIMNGAPFDVFMAADLSFPEKVIAAGLAEEAEPVVYAQGTLVLWTRNDTPFAKLTPATLVATLRDPAVKSIAVANAEHAPYGRAAQAALTKMGLYEALRPKLVVAENIAQTAQFVESGNAQLGLISLTSAKTARLSAAGHYVEIPREDYPPLEQGAIVVKHAGADTAAAHKLLEFLATPKIVDELKAGGLAPAHPSQGK